MNRGHRWRVFVRHALQTTVFLGVVLVLAAVLYSSVVVQRNRRAQQANPTATLLAVAQETAIAQDEDIPRRPTLTARDIVCLYVPSEKEEEYSSRKCLVLSDQSDWTGHGVESGNVPVLSVDGEEQSLLRAHTVRLLYGTTWERDHLSVIFTDTLPVRVYLPGQSSP